MLVVGRDSRSVVDRMLLGDTAAGVACRATCPVVTVPPAWDPDETKGLVVVGVKSSEHAEAPLAAGFAAASSLDARLLVVHAWKLPSAYDDIVVSRVAEQEWAEQGANELGAVLAPYEARHPGVEVTVRVTHSYAYHALEEASRHADLLILARRAHGFPAATHLGGTARHLLRNAECPVLVVAPLPHGGSGARDLEHAGHQGQ